ncbi:MAG: GNAT family N-acetyltransferase [Oscillospiraceae bacterium]|nr:GNAT family N-acetyltransferase [Oscillospiraceae bacterium]
MSFQIIDLPKEQWQGTVIPMSYTADHFYDVSLTRKDDGFSLDVTKRPRETPFVFDPAHYDFPDKLYESWWEGAKARGVVEDGKLLAVIETCPEEWSNRLRVTELWVDPSLQRKGIGRALMDTAKEQAVREGRRALILETQSSNANAVDFYLSQGFTLIGFDACCYSNNDIARREVRLEMGILFP